jgi:hypothetical protein
MTLQDPNARLKRDTTPIFRLSGFRLRFRPRPDDRTSRGGQSSPGARTGPSTRARARDLRRLQAIDRRLAAETPHLASMFTLFNRLTTGEGAAANEQLPPPPRTRLNGVHLAVLVTLAAVVALCCALSTQVHPVMKPCPALAAATSAGIVPVHTMSCSAYATNK